MISNVGRYQGMNPKFFDVKKEKQDAIINAALMVFAENGYRKASTDVMVKEAGISKGLLFHYFISKQGVYEFIYDYSVKYMMLELMQTVRKDERDFFSIQRMIELAKTRVMKNYPYMQQFLSSVKYENHPDALKVIRESDKVIDDTYASIYKKADMSRFRGPVDQQKIISMISWMSDGYIKDKFREGTPDLDEMNAEFAQYLSMLRDHFYGNPITEKAQPIMPAIQEEVERDDSVMDSIRDEMMAKPAQEAQQPEQKRELSFEERLALGKKSAYAGDEQEAAAETAEEDEINEDVREEAEEESDVQDEISTEEAVEASEEDTVEAPEDTGDTEETEQEISEEAAEGSEQEETAEEEDETAEEAEEVTIKIPEETLGEQQEEEAEEEKAEEAEEPAEEPDAAKEPAEETVEESAQETSDDTVTISIDSFSDGYRDYDNYGVQPGDITYAASSTVTSYVPSPDLSFYEESRLGDFTYGSDARGGRGIPYDSSENIQIFVTEDAEGEEPAADEGGDDQFDISGLSEKIIGNTDRETAEAERNRELESMGPAPVLPDFSPENIRNRKADDDDGDENVHMFRPLKF